VRLLGVLEPVPEPVEANGEGLYVLTGPPHRLAGDGSRLRQYVSVPDVGALEHRLPHACAIAAAIGVEPVLGHAGFSLTEP
jgi:hypothetical protein